MVSKEQIVKGITGYIREDIKPMVTNSNFKFMLSAVASALDMNPALADSFFENPIVHKFADDMGNYDIDSLCVILTNAVNESGGFKMEIPAIPVLLPDEQLLVFAQKDIERLCNRIRGT